MSKFKVGDSVKLSEQGKACYEDCDSDPHSLTGAVIHSGVSTEVQWSNDKSNFYNENDLLLIEAPTVDTKPTNPKDAIGSQKIPLHLWPTTATVYGSMALLDGACKYGRNNWRAMGVRATVYIDAAMRHLIRYAAGEDNDPDSGLPQLAMVLACVAILVDAKEAGQLNDDREYPGGLVQLIERMTPQVARIKEHYKDKTPHHYSVADAAPKQEESDIPQPMNDHFGI